MYIVKQCKYGNFKDASIYLVHKQNLFYFIHYCSSYIDGWNNDIYIDNLFGDTLTHIVLEYKRYTPLYHGHILVQTKACLRVPYIQPINYTRVGNLYEMAYT